MKANIVIYWHTGLVACKVYGSRLLWALSSDLRFMNIAEVKKIASDAIISTLIKFNQCLSNCYDDVTEALMVMAMECSHTVVTHPVGYHVDNFSGNGGDKLKKSCVSYCHSNQNDVLARGCGGASQGFYVWALLDW